MDLRGLKLAEIWQVLGLGGFWNDSPIAIVHGVLCLLQFRAIRAKLSLHLPTPEEEEG
jgi:hypothetical protein